MMQQLRRPAGLVGIVLFVGLVLALAGVRKTDAVPGAPKPFEVAKVTFEQNATDGDFEVVFEAKGGSDGLMKFKVVAPDGRTVVDIAAHDTSTLGPCQIRFESPELKNGRRLRAAYPQGEYVFSGTTTSGAMLQSRTSLAHPLPATAAFVSPVAGAKGVAMRGTVITWKAVPGVAAYMVYVEQEELDVSVTAKLPASATSFTIPDGFLLPGTEYMMGIGTVTKAGNGSYGEATFTTAAK